MLATLGNSVPSGTDWLYEVKWDGYRALCFIDGGKLRMLSRRGIKIEKQFATVAAALSQSVKADKAIIDGEVVALDDNGNPSFQRLQNMTGFGTKPAVKGVAAPFLNFFAFDLLYLNGYDLRKAALIDRRQLLMSILAAQRSGALFGTFYRQRRRTLESSAGQRAGRNRGQAGAKQV